MSTVRKIALILLTLLLTSYLQTVLSGNNGLLITTTFPSIARDIEQLLCSSDRVVSIVPFGVDPHDYSLKPSDLELISRSNLIVSTKHTHFEIELRELVEKGVIKTEIIDIPDISGIVLRKNPSTGVLNYHMPIYDPLNYIVYLRHLVSVLEKLNPECSSVYRERVNAIANRVLHIYLNTPRLSKRAVVDYPYIQYAIDWIGFEIVDFIVEEHGLETTPDLRIIEEKIISREIDIVVVTEPVVSKHSIWLFNKAVENNIPVLRVYSPLVNKTIVDKLLYVYNQVVELTNGTGGLASVENAREQGGGESGGNREFLVIVTYVAGLALIVSTVFIIVYRRKVVS